MEPWHCLIYVVTLVIGVFSATAKWTGSKRG